MIRDVVESAWLNVRHFLHHLDYDVRKETRKHERLHMKIIRKKHSCMKKHSRMKNDLLPKYTVRKHTHTHTHIYIYIYIRGAYDKFPDFFVWALLLIVRSWNSSPLRSNLLRLQYTCCTVPTTSGRPHGSPLV